MNFIIGAVLTVLLTAMICTGLFIGLYFSRFRTIFSIRKLSENQDGFNLYSMDVKYDYNTKNIINSRFTDTPSFVNAVVKECIPFLPVRMKLPSFGCSAYRAFLDDGQVIMGRNYDFKLDTSCMMLYCNPKKGYKSISFCALNNIGADDVNASLSKKMACLAAPFCCLDGVNEKGVSIAVLTLDSEPVNQNTGKKKISTCLAIRVVLDEAATTREAVDLLKKYDMYAINGRDYHFFISDASGDSRVVEYDCSNPARTLISTPMPAITNFYARYIDKVQPYQKNGIYGHGRERYDRMMAILEPNKGILTKEKAWETLRTASTKPNPESITSNTQWSIIFNNTNPSAEIVLRREWDKSTFFPLTKPE